MGTTTITQRIDEVLEVARQLAGSGALGGIHVAIEERPSYDQLRGYRELAATYGLSLTMTANRIVLCPLSAPAANGPSAPGDGHRHGADSDSRERRWPAVMRWWRHR